MPMYEYRCKQCDTTFEVIQQIGEKTASCPDCSSNETEKLLSAACTIGAPKSAGSNPAGST